MQSITKLWTENKKAFHEKTLKQILSFAGDGKLKDSNATSQEFRDFLKNIPTKLLKKYGDECLITGFPDSGFALQDIINQIGSRLGFDVDYGLYRGKKNGIGYDGLWAAKDDYSLVVEVKTTDAYRINLNKISAYRNSLIEQKRIRKEKSSILIVVGREDTGDFEAQIRGSRHAWDVRLISVDTLFMMLGLKENLNDSKTLHQINTILKPLEYTRIDKLFELIFIASRDIQSVEEADNMMIEDEIENGLSKTKGKEKTEPVSFNEECIAKVEKHLKQNILKNTRTTYESINTKSRFICSVSRIYSTAKGQKYWFAFHPSQKEYMENGQENYVILGCGSAINTFLIPYSHFKAWIEYFWTTERETRMYWHVHIFEIDQRFYILQPGLQKGKKLDITEYKI